MSLFSGRMAGLARTPGALPSLRRPVLRVLRAIRHVLELSHGAAPAGEAMERAQGVSSGPRGPDSMVMVLLHRVVCEEKNDTVPDPTKPPRAVYLVTITNRPCLFLCSTTLSQ